LLVSSPPDADDGGGAEHPGVDPQMPRRDRAQESKESKRGQVGSDDNQRQRIDALVAKQQLGDRGHRAPAQRCPDHHADTAPTARFAHIYLRNDWQLGNLGRLP